MMWRRSLILSGTATKSKGAGEVWGERHGHQVTTNLATVSLIPFATLVDLAARWRPVTDAETVVAESLLADASTIIRAEAPNIDARIEGDRVLGAVARLVVCAMVRRAMSTPAGIPEAATQVSKMMGPFSASMTLSDRNLYLTKPERKRLGIRPRATTIDTLGRWNP